MNGSDVMALTNAQPLFQVSLRRMIPPFSAWLAVILLAGVFLPILPGMYWELRPLLKTPVWMTLFAHPMLPEAVLSTIISTCVGTFMAWLCAVFVAIQFFSGPAWRTTQQRLPLFLSLPHVAFAIGLFFLIAPSGWISRLIALLWGWDIPPDWVTVRDNYGLSLAVGLAIKESWFLLWMIGTVLDETSFNRQMVVARSLGYRPWQAWLFVLLPQLFPRMIWPITAVFAYGLSVVDMAMILGPTNPPTLAVLVWQWLNDADPAQQTTGIAASFLLLGLLIGLIGITVLLWRGTLWLMQISMGYSGSGKRLADSRGAAYSKCNPRGITDRSFVTEKTEVTERTEVAAKSVNRGLAKGTAEKKVVKRLLLSRGLWGIGYSTVAVLCVWSVAQGWFYPALFPEHLTFAYWSDVDFSPFWTSLWIGLSVSTLSVAISLVWLEWGPRQFTAWIYFPLVLPAMPLVVAQYSALLAWELDGTAVGVIWSHLLWGFPYAVLVLIGPYQNFDIRYLMVARTLGYSSVKFCFWVKWPMLIKPICAAFAVAFAVSIAQYLPTLFVGSGRWITVTTEAVSLSAGGSRQVLAVHAILQLILPLCLFFLATYLPRRFAVHRKGVR